MTRFTVVANTMQALVKYHGLRDWKLRIPYHDSISVNTTALYSRVQVSQTDEGTRAKLLVEGRPNEDALRRIQPVASRITGSSFEETGLRLESANFPGARAKGLGFSSSAGAALTFAIDRATKRAQPDLVELSKISRLFAASASRTMVGGFSRLYVGQGDDDTFSERFADERTFPLRTVIVPLQSSVKTESAHQEVESSPFFRPRIDSATRRCDEVERAIRGGDFRSFGELVEQDTMELHAVTMTGKNHMVVMSEDTIRVIAKVRELRSDNVDAYFSMQTGPSVFINTTHEDEEKVKRTMSRMGYRTLSSGVGREPTIERDSWHADGTRTKKA